MTRGSFLKRLLGGAAGAAAVAKAAVEAKPEYTIAPNPPPKSNPAVRVNWGPHVPLATTIMDMTYVLTTHTPMAFQPLPDWSHPAFPNGHPLLRPVKRE